MAYVTRQQARAIVTMTLKDPRVKSSRVLTIVAAQVRSGVVDATRFGVSELLIYMLKRAGFIKKLFKMDLSLNHLLLE